MKAKPKPKPKARRETGRRRNKNRVAGGGAEVYVNEAYSWQPVKCGSGSDYSSGGTLRPRKNQKRLL